MLIQIDRTTFDSLEDASLIRTCMEPTIRQIRGREYVFKSDFYLRLTRGQQAVLMYQILYGHSTYGIDEFFGSLSYALGNEAFWTQLINGMRHLGDNTIASLIEEMHRLYPLYRLTDTENEKERINQSLEKLIPNTTKLAAEYIRGHVEEFAETIG